MTLHAYAKSPATGRLHLIRDERTPRADGTGAALTRREWLAMSWPATRAGGRFAAAECERLNQIEAKMFAATPILATTPDGFVVGAV